MSKALDSRHIIDGHTMYVTRSKFPAEVQNNAKPPQYKSLPASNLVESSSSRSHDSSNKGTMSTLGLKPRVLKRKVLDLPVQK